MNRRFAASLICIFFCLRAGAETNLSESQPRIGRGKADVIYIGDSHSYGCFGKELDRMLRAAPARSGLRLAVRTEATCGSSSASWLRPDGNVTSCGYRQCDVEGRCAQSVKGKAPSLAQLLSESGPRLTVVELGSNMLKSNLERTMNDVRLLIDEITTSGSRCIWIGPPQAAAFFLPIVTYDKFVKLLKNTVENKRCVFINSDDKTNRQVLSDTMGLHYGCKAGAEWASKVFDEIQPLILN